MLRNSAQRKRLLEYLQATREHPTAARLYTQLRREFSRLSLGTVYRNLEILRSQGRVRVLTGDGCESRFDGRLEPHAHLYCRRCRRVTDLPLPPDFQAWSRDPAREGHRVDTCEVELTGVCRSCAGASQPTKEA